jgi:hypothetical protein
MQPMFKGKQSDNASASNKSGMQLSAEQPVLVCGRVVSNTFGNISYSQRLFLDLQQKVSSYCDLSQERQQLEHVEPAFRAEFQRRFGQTEKLKDFKMMPDEV